MEEIIDLIEKTNMRLNLKLYCVAAQGVQPARLSPCKKMGDGTSLLWRSSTRFYKGFVQGGVSVPDFVQEPK